MINTNIDSIPKNLSEKIEGKMIILDVTGGIDSVFETTALLDTDLGRGAVVLLPENKL